MSEWQFKITWSRVVEESFLPSETVGQGRIDDEVVDRMTSQLQGDGWEPVSHDISNLHAGLCWSIMWRRAK